MGRADNRLKRHLVRAIYDWCLEAGETPNVVVRPGKGTRVPDDLADETGSVVLNVAPAAVRDLKLGAERLDFTARFKGRTFDVIVGLEDLVAIIGKESGKGVMFPSGLPVFFGARPDPGDGPEDGGPAGDGNRGRKRRRSPPELKAY